MFGLSARLSAFLELQILSINVLGIIRLIWSWVREWEKLGVKHILNLPISQHNANGKDSWYKTILLWITNVRFIIDRITIFAYASNIITILARSWWNLLILWMLLSSIQAVLEVVIIITMSLLWYKENVPTLKFVEFIVEKLFWFVTSSYEWCTILKWYMRLRKAEKLRKFMIISRRSIADISQVPGRVGHSLDDELLAVAEIRRGKYASTASLLNLDSLSEESNRANFELRISKSLSTRISDNSHESNNSNNCDSIVNDLSVAEKSMKLLRITAEDMMDARARIHERSHWSEQNVSRETSKAMEEIVAEVILEKERTEINMNEFMNNEQVVKKATDSTSKKKVDIQNFLTEGEREKDDRKKPLVERREDSNEKRAEADIKSQDVVLQRKENPEISEKFVQCPSESRRNGNFQPTASTSLVKKLEAKLDSIPASHEKWIDSNDRSRGVKTSRLTPTNSSIDKKEDLRVSSCEFHRAMYTNSALLRNGSCIRSAADDTDKDVRDDVDRKEAKHSASPTNIQIEKLNGYNSRLNYSEIYRLKKQIQKSNKPCGKRPVTWGSKSLAQTARPSGYAKNFVAADRSRFICQNAHTEIFDEPSDSSSARSKLKQVGRIENKRSVELCSVYNVISRKRRNYAKSEKHEAELLTSDDNPALLKDKRDVRARKRCVLSPKTLLIEEREAIERMALRAYNELTLLEDKKRLKVKKERDSSLNCAQSTRELNVPERQVHEDFTLLRDKQETETIRRHNPSLSREQSNEESIVSKPRDELTSSGDKKEKREAPSNYEETVKVSTEMIRTVSNRLPESSQEETVNCPSFETRVNTNSSEGNDRPAIRHRLNLREITRNIEWTVHPEGIVLANKSLRSQFSSERLRERQRDIVDDNTASMLHSAFFFKPEIVTRIFRRTQLTTNESSPTVAPRRQDFSTDFACRMNNEVIVQDQNTLFGLDLEQMMERSDGLGCSLFSNINTDDNTSNNRVIEEESNRNSHVISVELEQIVPESVTVSTENSAVEPQEDILAASGLVESREEENAIITDLPLQFVTDILRNIDTEGDILGPTSSNEQLEDRSMNNVIVDYDFRPEKLSTDDTSFIEENNNECDGNLLDRSANIAGIINDPSRQFLDSNNDCLDNNASFVNSTGENNLHNSQDDKYLKATDIYPENKVYKNNLFLKSSDNDATSQLSENNNDKNNNNNSNNLLDAVINKAEKIVFNHDLENSSKLSFPGPSSVIESDNCHASIVGSNDENLQRFTQLSDSEAMIENQKSKSINSEANDDTTLQFWTLENTKFKTGTRDIARSENKVTDICETASEIPTTGFLEMNSEQLRQDDSFYSTYERDKSETPNSLEGGSLMEEFSDNTISSAMSSYSQAFKSSTQS